MVVYDTLYKYKVYLVPNFLRLFATANIERIPLGNRISVVTSSPQVGQVPVNFVAGVTEMFLITSSISKSHIIIIIIPVIIPNITTNKLDISKASGMSSKHIIAVISPRCK